MYVFYGILGVDGLTGTGMELKKSCVLVDCVRIRGGWGRLLLGLCFGICLYFVQCTDDLDADINDCDILWFTPTSSCGVYAMFLLCDVVHTPMSYF